MKISAGCLCLLVATVSVMSAGCGSKETPTNPTPIDPGPIAAPPAFTEEFIGVVPVSGATFYSFTVTQFGTVNLTLRSVGGAFVPPTVTLGFGIGVPDAEGCVATTAITTSAGTEPQLTGNFSPGVHCALVHDVGNLFAPANITVSIAFP